MTIEEEIIRIESGKHSKTRFNEIWKTLKQKCLNINSKNYTGKKLDEKWLTFEGFKEDMFASYKQLSLNNLFLVRYDLEGDFVKDNCYWSLENKINSYSNYNLEDGLNLKQYCVKYNLNYKAILQRLSTGMSFDEAINKPIRKFIMIEGITLSEYCKKYNLDYRMVKKRLELNWSLEEAVGIEKNCTREEYNKKIKNKFRNKKYTIINYAQRNHIEYNLDNYNSLLDIYKTKILLSQGRYVNFSRINVNEPITVHNLQFIYNEEINLECQRDILGKKYNKLTVIEIIGKKKNKLVVKCKCDCGKEIIVNDASTLKYNNKKSCGCDKKHTRIIDLTNQKFGRLFVQKYIGIKNKEALWLCKCECGNIKEVVSSALRKGTTKSCGCLRKYVTAKRSRVNLQGKFFGKLKVLEDYIIEKQSVKWKCQCECGNIVYVRGNDLLCDKTHSCGCLTISKPEQEIMDYVKTLTKEKVCKANILNRKQIDVYIEKLKLGIEYNGSVHHASKNNPYKNKPKNYHYDKYLIAKEKGIRLINIFDIDYNVKMKLYLKHLILPKQQLETKLICKIENYQDFLDKYCFSSSTDINECYGIYNEGLKMIIGFQDNILKIFDCKFGYEIVDWLEKIMQIKRHFLVEVNCDLYSSDIFYKHGFTFVKHVFVCYNYKKYKIYRCGKDVLEC